MSVRFRPGHEPGWTEIAYSAEIELQGVLQPLSFSVGAAAKDQAESVRAGLEQARLGGSALRRRNTDGIAVAARLVHSTVL